MPNRADAITCEPESNEPRSGDFEVSQGRKPLVQVEGTYQPSSGDIRLPREKLQQAWHKLAGLLQLG